MKIYLTVKDWLLKIWFKKLNLLKRRRNLRKKISEDIGSTTSMTTKSQTSSACEIYDFAPSNTILNNIISSIPLTYAPSSFANTPPITMAPIFSKVTSKILNLESLNDVTYLNQVLICLILRISGMGSIDGCRENFSKFKIFQTR